MSTVFLFVPDSCGQHGFAFEWMCAIELELCSIRNERRSKPSGTFSTRRKTQAGKVNAALSMIIVRRPNRSSLLWGQWYQAVRSLLPLRSIQFGKMLYWRKVSKPSSQCATGAGNGKEAIHPTAIWQTEKSKLNFIIWYFRTVLFLVCVLFMSFSRVQRACWRIIYMIVSLFFLVLVFPLFSWLQPLFNRYFSSGLTFFSPVKRKKSFADWPTDYFFDI